MRPLSALIVGTFVLGAGCAIGSGPQTRGTTNTTGTLASASYPSLPVKPIRVTYSVSSSATVPGSPPSSQTNQVVLSFDPPREAYLNNDLQGGKTVYDGHETFVCHPECNADPAVGSQSIWQGISGAVKQLDTATKGQDPSVSILRQEKVTIRGRRATCKDLESHPGNNLAVSLHGCVDDASGLLAQSIEDTTGPNGYHIVERWDAVDFGAPRPDDFVVQ